MRLKLVLRGRRLGFSLKEIAEIIDLYDAPNGERGQLETLMERIADRREDLLAKRADIDAALAQLDRVEMDCRRQLKTLEDMDAPVGAAKGRGA